MRPHTDEHLEAELRAAIDDGDAERIDSLSHIIDSREKARAAVPLVSAALYYADLGLRVFPLQSCSKLPLRGSHGCKDATTDHERIRAWWDREPDANIGIATGHLVDVVDVDGTVGQRSRARHWCAEADCDGTGCVDHEPGMFARIDAACVGKVLTPRPGGMHIYVPTAGEPNATNVAPSVDVRGIGGYVVAPPSRTDVGTYRWLGTPNLGSLAAAQGAA